MKWTLGLSVLIFVIFAVSSAPANSRLNRYKIRYQPELDNVSIDPYIKNPRLWKLEINCLLFDGPCDAVGRWAMPRIAPVLLGQECPKCTKNQAKEVEKLIAYVAENRPELFRIAISKYVLDAGIDLPPDSPLLQPPGDTDNIEIPDVKGGENVNWAKEIFGINGDTTEPVETSSAIAPVPVEPTNELKKKMGEVDDEKSSSSE